MAQGELTVTIRYNLRRTTIDPSLTRLRKLVESLKEHQSESIQVHEHECPTYRERIHEAVDRLLEAT